MAATEELARLLEIMHRLRAECPWDRAQTHRSLRPYLLEEAYETLQALDGDDADEVCEELGDLLLQIVFHAEIGAEAGEFDMADVVRAISEKLVRRHPHVFAAATAETPAEVARRWARIKAREKAKRASALDGLPAGMPALLRAARVAAKMRQSGVDAWAAADPAAVAEAELGKLRSDAELPEQAAERAVGRLCAALVELASRLHVNAEDALRNATERLAAAFRAEEARAEAGGRAVADLPARALGDAADRIASTLLGD